MAETDADGNTLLKVPFPFTEVIKKIQAKLPTAPTHALPVGADETSSFMSPFPIRGVLIPEGRSLQRKAAFPDFYQHPRVILGVDTPPQTPSPDDLGMQLNDRLFLGYQEKAEIIEVISYNEKAGRFEFQIVKDFRPGGSPKIYYANRAVCVTCHQGEAPIFSEQPWGETNADLNVFHKLVDELGKSALKPENQALKGRLESREISQVSNGGKVETVSFYHGVAVAQDDSTPYEIDKSAIRANQIPILQKLWAESCSLSQDDPATKKKCRAQALGFILQAALSGDSGFDSYHEAYRKDYLPLVKRIWSEKWPSGIEIANSEILNRFPLDTPISDQLQRDDERLKNLPPEVKNAILNSNVPPQYEPALADRPRKPEPEGLWVVHEEGGDQSALNRMITGLAQFFTPNDRKILDDKLFEAGKALPTRRFRFSCTAKVVSSGDLFTLKFKKCSSPAGLGPETDALAWLDGVLVANQGKITRESASTLNHLTLRETGSSCQIDPSLVSGGALDPCPTLRSLKMSGTVETVDTDGAPSSFKITLQPYSSLKKLHARTPGGDAISSIQLEVAGAGDQVAIVGTVEVMTDFAPVAKVLSDAAEGNEDALVGSVFSRTSVLKLLYPELGLSAQPHSCCELEAALPKAAEELQVGFTAQELSSGKLGKLVGGLSKYCIACHRQEGQATPWLLGSYDQAEARIRHCADRLLFRLKMNEAPDRTSRPAGAMPLKLQSVLDNLSVRPDQWELDRRALVDSLSEISPFAAAVRARSNSDDSRDGFQKKLLDEMISGGVRGYDSLPACLESGGGKP